MRRRMCHQRSGFTLVEIMIVVAVIGLLASIAIPSFARSRRQSRITATVSDFRVYFSAFQQYVTDSGDFSNLPEAPGVVPAHLASYVDGVRWAKGPPVGGQWYYKSTCFGALGGRPALGIVGTAARPPDAAAMLAIDEAMDNGDLTSGNFVRLGLTAYYYYLDL